MHPMKKYGMVPDHSFLQEMNSCSVATVPAGFYDEVENGSIILKRSKTFSFYKEGILLENSTNTLVQMEEATHIKCDLVIFATGFKGDQKLKDIFASPIFQDYIFGSPSNTIPLYRECVHPRIPQVAVIGFSESAGNLFTSEMRCRWLFELLDGKFRLPSIRDMEKDVLEWNNFMKRYSGSYGVLQKILYGSIAYLLKDKADVACFLATKQISYWEKLGERMSISPFGLRHCMRILPSGCYKLLYNVISNISSITKAECTCAEE
uniref:Flavin-containing monooxygenase n=1 Tax=Chenopodium quinoa TaxID=63459 RepID=A0A803MLF1_CHEQI